MSDFIPNIAKGRIAELAARVNANDPTNSAFVIAVLALSGVESDAVLRDKDTLADVVSGTTNEVTNTNYARKTLDQAAGITIVVDDTNDAQDVDIPDQTWTAVASGDGWSDFLVLYDSDTTGGADSAIVPLSVHDFAVTPDGSDITAQIASGGFFHGT